MLHQTCSHALSEESTRFFVGVSSQVSLRTLKVKPVGAKGELTTLKQQSALLLEYNKPTMFWPVCLLLLFHIAEINVFFFFLTLRIWIPPRMGTFQMKQCLGKVRPTFSLHVLWIGCEIFILPNMFAKVDDNALESKYHALQQPIWLGVLFVVLLIV